MSTRSTRPSTSSSSSAEMGIDRYFIEQIAEPGQIHLALDNVEGLEIGDVMVINKGAKNEELVQITSLKLQDEVRNLFFVFDRRILFRTSR